MFQLQPASIGVDIGKSSLRFAALRKTQKGWKVEALKEISSEEDPLPFCAQYKKNILISAVSTRDVLIRPCEIELKKKKDVITALEFHVEPLLPYPLEKAIVQSQIMGLRENTTLLSVCAMRQDHLASHLEVLKLHGLEPESVTSRSHALAALSPLLSQTQAPFLIVHEGEDELAIVLVEKGIVLAARIVESKKDQALEIEKILLSFAAAHKTKAYEAIYFFGKDPVLKTLFQNLSDKPLLPPSSPLLSLTHDEWIHYGLAIGTALAFKSVNFRQKEFAYPRPFKRLKGPLATYFTLALLLAGSIGLIGEMTINQKKEVIEKAYRALLKDVDKKLDTLPGSSEKYALVLNGIEKEIRAKPEIFSLLPQVPKVKEVLSWLTSLTGPAGKEGAPIIIEALHYQMVTRPDFAQKKERYRVRVDLEWSAQDLTAARAFQEALKSDNSLVDTAEEIQMFQTRGKYKASFFLKDKTKYA